MFIPMVSDKLNIARLATGPTLAWKAENAPIADGAFTLERVQFNSQTLPVMCRMSVELSEDSANIDQVIQREFAAALAAEIDRAALRGSGTSPEPRGVLNQANVAIQNSGAAGAALTYDAILDAGYTVLGANVPPDNLRVIYNARAARSLGKIKDTTANT